MKVKDLLDELNSQMNELSFYNNYTLGDMENTIKKSIKVNADLDSLLTIGLDIKLKITDLEGLECDRRLFEFKKIGTKDGFPILNFRLYSSLDQNALRLDLSELQTYFNKQDIDKKVQKINNNIMKHKEEIKKHNLEIEKLQMEQSDLLNIYNKN